MFKLDIVGVFKDGFVRFYVIALVSAALVAFCLVLYGFGLVIASFAICLVLCILCWSRPLSLRFVWFCLVWGWSLPVLLFCVGMDLGIAISELKIISPQRQEQTLF